MALEMTSKKEDENNNNNKIKYEGSWDIGRRASNEDVHRVMTDRESGWFILAVCDGHGGVTVARRSAEARRLLGLRRAVHFTMAGAPPPVTRPPAAVIKAGTTPKAAK